MGMIAEVMPGQLVRIIVQAVNGNLQGVASDPIEFTMPVAHEARMPAAPAPVLEQALTAPQGNGSSTNGHANGRRQSARLG
jgi:hypothetical protein